MSKNLIIAGCGGFGAEAIWVAEDMNEQLSDDEKWHIIGYVDDDPRKALQERYGYRVSGAPEEVAAGFKGVETWYFCAIGDNAIRRQMSKRLDGLGWHAATLIHPTAVRAGNVRVGDGTYVGALCILSPNSSLGKHVIVNQHSAIGHDSLIGDYANICPGAKVNGYCRVGEGALVGSNASLMQSCVLGEKAVVGANSFVVHNIPDGVTVMGVPARRIT
jgi:sugar O-acyltransferase (sialic acid O-acetyltransferase NeuD family)